MTQLIGYWIKYAKSKNYYWAENFERNAEIFRLQILSKKSNTKIRTYSKLETAIYCAMDNWDETPEGYDYWKQVYDSLKHEADNPNVDILEVKIIEVLAKAILENREWSLAAMKYFIKQCENDPNWKTTIRKSPEFPHEFDRNPYKHAILAAFVWGMTDEGSSYWCRIVNELTCEFESGT